jgi:putative transposase
VSRAHRGPERLLRLVPSPARGARAQQNQGLLTQIRTCYQASRGCYGSPRIHHELRTHGLRVGRHRVARLMRVHGLRSVRRPRRWRQPADALPAVVRANVLRRAFTATRPNEKWAADITYVPTRQGWLYLAVVIDLYSRRVVGWAMDAQQTTALTVTALEMALRQRPVLAGLLHHSDRGSQYGAVAYQHRLVSCGIRGSMSRPGNCWDNAVVESFFATLKTELMRGRLYHTGRKRARRSLRIWRDFIIGLADIPPWAISAPWSSKSGPLTQPMVSTESGEVHNAL